MSTRIARIELPLGWFRAVGLAVLVMLALAKAFMPGAPLPDEGVAPLPLSVIPLPDNIGRLPALGHEGRALLLGVDEATRTARAELRFEIPPRTPESPQWVLWMRRVPVESLEVGVDGVWQGGERSFLTPDAEHVPLPVGYVYRLPSSWEGEIRLQLSATALRTTALQPHVMTEARYDREVQRTTLLNAFGYASVFTLGVVGLALFFASRDQSFLWYFVFCLSAGLLMAAFDGHAYLFDPFGLTLVLGGAGMHAMSLVFEVAALWVLLDYAETRQSRPLLESALNHACVFLLLVAGVLLAWRQALDGFSAWFMPLAWLAGCVAGVVVTADAWRRRVPMAAPVLLSVLALGAGMLAWELAARGVLGGTLWTMYGYQAGLMLCAAMLGVGLISRISRYREQRDREQRARADSERRMYREAVRTELLTALQTSLRGAQEDAIQPIVFRLLLEHLRRVVPTTTAVAVARGYHGRDTLVVQPASYLAEIEGTIGQRLQTLRRQMAGSLELQRPVTKTGASVPVAIEALVALPVRPPGWGLIVLERAGATVFHPDELTLVRELARLALLQADEAIAALHLRYTAEVDALTGALNRRSLDQALLRTFQEASRKSVPLSVLFVDIDRFKSINDQHGHACGDHCLREVARIINEQLNEEDVFGRYGGEEFLVILPGRQSEMARAIAENIRAALESTLIEHNELSLGLTVSIGVASQSPGEHLPQAAVDRADKALYAAKRAGRNRVNVAPAVFAPRASTA